ncbi:MAG: hypothetical protein NWS00_03230, partial [Opitutales bacterium]|nr:hypothetical protein [Opitutales bacterium]
MPKPLPTAHGPRLFHGVCSEARAALVASLAKASTTTVALVADPRRAMELSVEVQTYAGWTKQSIEVLH